MSFVATRFAPSPTGPLHIGGVRTALFNWLFSKNNKGKFYLRIEDTDKERSKEEYKKQIIESLNWIGIFYDDKEYIQSEKINDHKKIAEKLLQKDFAYKCYCSEKEINEQKNNAKKKGIPFIYNRKWRDSKNLAIPTDVKPVIRFKSKISGNSIIQDLVQGEINISNSTIEDFVILRQDGSPTYQLSATVDDHLMNITHVIRGDDHKINAFKQKQIYEAMEWKIPNFAHIPLIHSNEGRKLSKNFDINFYRVPLHIFMNSFFIVIGIFFTILNDGKFSKFNIQFIYINIFSSFSYCHYYSTPIWILAGYCCFY